MAMPPKIARAITRTPGFFSPISWVRGGVVILLLSSAAIAQTSGSALQIGVLDDQSGPLSALSGVGSVTAARMAVEDFGGSVLGQRVEVVAADHQNKADVGSAIARQWFDERNVTMITGLGNSSVSIA